MSDNCDNCGGDGKCAAHSSIEHQMKELKDLPNSVSKMTGIVSVIAGLFALLVGLAFNSHFEQLHQAENMIKRFDALGTQMADIGKEHQESKRRLGERLVRIETRLDSIQEGK